MEADRVMEARFCAECGLKFEPSGWFAAHPGVAVVCTDTYGCFKRKLAKLV